MRDIHLFKEIVVSGGRVQVNMTVTTDDEDVRRAFEPSCPGNRMRLEATRKLVAAGVETCVTMTPLLLVRDAEAFAEALLKTRAQGFIIKPFHFQRGKFVAGTRETALGMMAEKLSSGMSSFRERYLDHYREVREVLLRRLPLLGEGKEGFRPPF